MNASLFRDLPIIEEQIIVQRGHVLLRRAYQLPDDLAERIQSLMTKARHNRSLLVDHDADAELVSFDPETRTAVLYWRSFDLSEVLAPKGE